jgi:hypothetical protein
MNNQEKQHFSLIFNQVREDRGDGGLEIGSCYWLLRRPLHGQYETLMAKLAAEDPASYKKFTRIRPDMSRGSNAMRPNPLRKNH